MPNSTKKPAMALSPEQTKKYDALMDGYEKLPALIRKLIGNAHTKSKEKRTGVELANFLGMQPTNMTRYLQGVVKFKLSHILKILCYYDIDFEEALGIRKPTEDLSTGKDADILIRDMDINSQKSVIRELRERNYQLEDENMRLKNRIKAHELVLEEG